MTPHQCSGDSRDSSECGKSGVSGGYGKSGVSGDSSKSGVSGEYGKSGGEYGDTTRHHWTGGADSVKTE